MAQGGVHLAGSFPDGSFTTPEEVFTYALSHFPRQLKRVPDGELGARHNFVGFQFSAFPPQVLRQESSSQGTFYEPKLEDFKDLGYADAAIASYATFSQLKGNGKIPTDFRFQVSLPSPFEAVGCFVALEYQSKVAPLYEAKLLQELDRIQKTIPAAELAVQWDAALIVGFLETSRGADMAPPLQAMLTAWDGDAVGGEDSDEKRQARVWQMCMDALVRVSKAVLPDVELGYHLCYGDLGHTHFYEPKNLELLVSIANHLVEMVQPQHNIAWMHMPVPKWVSNESYFEALQHLNLDSSTELYLGLVHYDDLEGSRKKVELARSVWKKSFGIGTECGMGRTPKEQMDGIFKVCATLADAAQ